jgi:hypothetical protein
MPPQGAPQQPQPMPPQGMPQAQQQLPEDQGIAQLPTPNMQGMADGGIVGYADGGPVAFSGEAESLVRSQTGGKDWFLDIPKTIRDPSVPYYREIPNPKAALADRRFGSRAEAVLAYDTGGNPSGGPHPRSAESTVPSAAPTVKPAALPPSNAGQGQGQRGEPAPVPVNDTVLAERLAAKPKTEAGIQSLVNAGAGAGAGISQASAPTSDPAAMAAEYAKIRDAYTPQNRFGKEIGELTAAERTMLEQEKAQALADIEKRGPAMAGYETRLKGKEERLAKQEADLSGMSFVEAGLAIMAGTSPNALSNIGAGAQVGVKSYKSGLEKLSEARDKLDESFAKIEELRRSEGIANDKDIRQMNKGIAQTFVKAKDMGLNALMEDGKLGRKEAETAFTTLAANRRSIWEQEKQTERTAMQEAGQNARASMQEAGANARAATQERGANARAGMLPGEARMLMQLGGGDLKKGMEIQQSIGATKFNPIASYADYVKAFAGKETVTPPMSFADYVAQFQGPKVVNVTPASLKP